MGEQRIEVGSSAPSIRFFALRDDAPVSLTSEESGLAIGWRRSLAGIPLAASFTSLSLSDLGSVNAAWSGGGKLIVVNASTGEHRLDLPESAAAEGADAIDFNFTATDTDLVMFPAGRVALGNLSSGASVNITTEEITIVSENS